jgi:VIT1/CCC1 family predicted Fe2+/Mn2+ transporter
VAGEGRPAPGSRAPRLTSGSVAPKGQSGPGRAQRKGTSTAGRTTVATRSRVGRYTSPEHSGKYTPPLPKSAHKSPRWYGAVVLALLVLGVLLILLNYLTVLPGAVSAWYLVAGLVVIFVGFVMATRYR